MEITLLDKDDVCGSNALQIFKKYGTNAAVTDFSILLGCGVTSDHTSDSTFYDLDTRSADYFTKTKANNKIVAISSYGFEYNGEKKLDDRFIGIRPIVKYSDIKNSCYDEILSDKNVKEVKFGEYPQTLCEKKTYNELEELYKKGMLKRSNKIYTTDSKISGQFKKQTHIEYEYNVNKYIRFIADRNIVRAKLSDEKNIEYNKAYWIKTEPIIWMIDEKENIAVSKRILISGIPFDDNYNCDYNNSLIKKYLNEYFAKEILAEKPITKKDRFCNIKAHIDDLTLEELQELRIIIEEEMREKAKVRCKGGIK